MLAMAQVMPGKLLWFTLIYPALCFWLLWGGSIWPPVVAMAGFGVLYAVFRFASPLHRPVRLQPGPACWRRCCGGCYLDVPLAGALQSMLPFGLASRSTPTSSAASFWPSSSG